MINNYTIKHKQCRQHQLPESFLCLDPQCRSVGLLCSNCIPGIHSHHYQQISSLEDFREHLQTLIRREKLNHERSSIINVAGLVKAKKQEL